jgi:hypothetical protein
MNASKYEEEKKSSIGMGQSEQLFMSKGSVTPNGPNLTPQGKETIGQPIMNEEDR